MDAVRNSTQRCGPLDILVRALVCLQIFIEKGQCLNAHDNEVAELAALPIKIADVPAQTGIYQCEGHDDSLGLPAAH